MKKGLYILFEGLSDTVIDSQVMAHVADMRKKNIVDFEIWGFAVTRELYERSQKRLQVVSDLSGGKVRLFRGARPAIPLSSRINSFLLGQKINLYKPEFDLIHARTNYSASVCSYLKLKYSFDLIWDCRGDAEGEYLLKFQKHNFFIRQFKRYQIKKIRWRIKRAAAACDKAIFVSTPLLKMHKSKIGETPYQIIPGLAPEQLFFYDPQLRAEMRSSLSVSESERLLIYSGTVTYYQSFPQSIELFRQLRDQEKSYRLLVVTPQIHAAKEALSDLPDHSYLIRRAAFEEVNGYLNAADCALMILEDISRNRAAFPIKFSEYCLAGLPIVMSKSVPDAYQIARRLGNLIEYKVDATQIKLPIDRQNLSQKSRLVASRSTTISKYRQVYLH
ncbi:MAG: hypothetical protein B6244_11295 [Candidatus Cloacimonetes bacterium 4572_55]|nr:MAG: hypothetical protein B6244_11295 [Candidatus Cloacimonetes bacterium 4572_55]